MGNNSGTLQFNGGAVVTGQSRRDDLATLNGDAVRYALLSVNGSQGTPVSFPSTGSFQTVRVNTDDRHFEHRQQQHA